MRDELRITYSTEEDAFNDYKPAMPVLMVWGRNKKDNELTHLVHGYSGEPATALYDVLTGQQELVDDVVVKFIPLDIDTRAKGYATNFKCSNCEGIIDLGHLARSLDYSYCPWCGEKSNE